MARTSTRKPSRLPSLSPASWLLSLAALLLVILPTVDAVKRHDFKTCDQSGFCRRNRALADRAAAHADRWSSPYEIQNPSFSQGRFTAGVANALFPDIHFALEVRFHDNGVARILMDEVNGLRQRYNEAAKWAIENEPVVDETDAAYQVDISPERTSIKYSNGRQELLVEHKPVRVTFLRDGQPHIVLNERGLLNMEHFRVKSVGGDDQAEELVVQDPEHPGEQRVVVKDEAFPGFLPPDDDGMWEEGFNGKRDTKPKGPESLSVDITFPGYEHVYGIPEHASTLSLKTTRGGDGAYTDPYRLYNLDVFEYEVDSEMALYGSVPFLQAHRAGSTVGVFLANAAEMWVDVTKSSTSKAIASAYKKAKKGTTGDDAGPGSTTTSTHWIAESGILDLFVYLGPSALDILDQYTHLTGRAQMPQYFGLGYHQSRWNYNNEDDVQTVQEKFDEFDIPLDEITLDIEYAAEHKYFIWDRRNFPTPEKMQEKLAERGRKLVVIVDPHIKRTKDLYVYTEAQELDILCKKPDGKTEYNGHCWTGDSAWVDWFNPRSHEWWPKLFRFDKFEGSTKNLFIWNDMNEPSVFDGPEITMYKDAIHHGGWEHRDVHNINGMIYQNLSMQGLIQREDPPKRPFVLSRAYYAGSQRYGAIWTGDNIGDWPHLQSTVPMLLSNNIAGIVFIGSDVGGFFGDPSPEMITRWHQVGAFSPFFRAHGHIDTKRREVYLWDEPYRSIMRDAIKLRYSLLPAFYTAFYEASLTGVPILRPQYLVHPNDAKGFAIDDQFYLGNTGLLVKPIVEEGKTSADVYISDDQPYYHYLTHDIYFGASHGGSTVKVPAPLESIPILQRGGHILTRRDRVRRSAILTWRDPITLVAAVDLSGTSAVGSLYLDDGESYDNEKGDFVYRQFKLEPQQTGSKTLVLRNRAVQDARSTFALAAYDPTNNSWAQKIADVVVREIVLLGLPSKPTCVKLAGSSNGLDFEWTDGVGATGSRRSSGKGASVLKIKDANSAVVRDWDIVFSFDSSSACSSTAAINHDAALQSPQCPAGQFYCHNEGHIPSCILRSRVNDGICDPECCDGSDETDAALKLCPNRCRAVNDEYRKVKAEEDRKHRVGASVRNDYIKFGAREKTKLEDEVKRVEGEIVRLQQKDIAAKAALEALENDAAGEIERKKDSELYRRIVEMQTAIKALRLHRTNLEGHISDLCGILSDLSRDFNPNYQDMAVLGATRSYKDWRIANGLGESTEVGEGGEVADVPAQQLGDAELVDDYSDDDLLAFEGEDPLSLIDSLGTRVGSPIASGVANIFRLDDYVPDKWRPQYDTYKKSFLDLLARAGLIYPPVLTDNADRPDLTRAREAHSRLVDQVKEQERKLEEARKGLEKDWGRDWEWKKLDGTCVEKDTGEYTYSVCFFGEASQRSNSNNMKTSLGRFKGWSSTAEEGTDAYYEKQLYADGQRCWNGPARSAKVDLVCGTSNALLSVIEPEKCEYLFKVATPAVCFPQKDQDEGAAHEKDEL